MKSGNTRCVRADLQRQWLWVWCACADPGLSCSSSRLIAELTHVTELNKVTVDEKEFHIKGRSGSGGPKQRCVELCAEGGQGLLGAGERE